MTGRVSLMPRNRNGVLLEFLAGPNGERSLIMPPGFIMAAALAVFRSGEPGMWVALPARVNAEAFKPRGDVEPRATSAVRVEAAADLHERGVYLARIADRDQWRLFCDWVALEGL